jgi:hypothetical protein
MSDHPVVSGIALQVVFLTAAYMVFDTVGERREQARWRRVAEAAAEDLLSSAQVLLDVVKAEVVPVWAPGPYADDAEVLRC